MGAHASRLGLHIGEVDGSLEDACTCSFDKTTCCGDDDRIMTSASGKPETAKPFCMLAVGANTDLAPVASSWCRLVVREQAVHSGGAVEAHEGYIMKRDDHSGARSLRLPGALLGPAVARRIYRAAVRQLTRCVNAGRCVEGGVHQAAKWAPGA